MALKEIPTGGEESAVEPKKPFQWGDEEEKAVGEDEIENEGRVYSSVAELLRDEEIAELKRLEEFFRKLSERQ